MRPKLRLDNSVCFILATHIPVLIEGKQNPAQLGVVYLLPAALLVFCYHLSVK
jgi:hypothetical protein